jgi:hypothetical protein
MDIMSYHYNISDQDVQGLSDRLDHLIDTNQLDSYLQEKGIGTWDMSPRYLSREDSLFLTLFMFHDLGVIGTRSWHL